MHRFQQDTQMWLSIYAHLLSKFNQSPTTFNLATMNQRLYKFSSELKQLQFWVARVSLFLLILHNLQTQLIMIVYRSRCCPGQAQFFFVYYSSLVLPITFAYYSLSLILPIFPTLILFIIPVPPIKTEKKKKYQPIMPALF